MKGEILRMILKEIKSLYKKTGYHKKLMILFFIIIGTVVIEVMTIPYIEIQILDKYIPQSDIKGLVIFVAMYIAIFLLQCYMVLMHCDMRCILKRLIQKDLREKVFSNLQYVKAKFYDENNTGTILQLLQDDTSKAGELFPIVITEMFFMGVIRFTVYLVFLLFINVKLTLAILSLYIIGFIITLIVNRKTVEKINQIRKINMEIYSYINEGIQSFFTIKTLGIIEKRSKELQIKLEEFSKNNIKLEKIISIYQRVFELIISISTIIIIYFGGIEVLEGIMTYATITLMIGYSSQLEYEFNWFIKHLTDFNQSVISYSKNQCEQKGRSSIIITTDEYKQIALIGRTGSGKTTITNLLSRLYELQKGKILINGRENKEYTIKSIRNKIGYIMQEVQIVPNTIVDNIKYVNNDITLEEIEEIFKQLKLHEKIMSFKNGYYTNIYSNPNLLSTRRTSIN